MIISLDSVCRLGQPIRLLLHYVGQEFEDLHFEVGNGPAFSREAWLSKKYTFGLEFPNLPFYIDGDVKITTSNAIIMYIGRKHDMVGKSEPERILVDMLLNLAYDIAFSAVMAVKNPKYDELKGELFSKMTKQELPLLEKHLEDGAGWFVGNSVTVVDFPLYERLEFLRTLNPDILEDFPRLKDFMSRIEALPAIKKYMESDNFITSPFCNKPYYY